MSECLSLLSRVPHDVSVLEILSCSDIDLLTSDERTRLLTPALVQYSPDLILLASSAAAASSSVLAYLHQLMDSRKLYAQILCIHGINKLQEDRIVAILASWHDRLANRGIVVKKRAFYWNLLRDIVERGSEVSLQRFGKLVGKLITVKLEDVFVGFCIECSGKEQQVKILKSVIQGLSFKTLNTLFTEFFRSSASETVLLEFLSEAFILHNSIGKNLLLRFDLTFREKEKLIDFARKAGDTERILLEYFQSLSELWCNSATIKYWPIENHTAFAKTLAKLLLFIPEDSLHTSTSVIQGIQFRMETDEQQLQKSALIVADSLKRKMLSNENISFKEFIQEEDEKDNEKRESDEKVDEILSEAGSDTLDNDLDDEDDPDQSWFSISAKSYHSSSDKKWDLNGAKMNRKVQFDPKQVVPPVFSREILDYLSKNKKDPKALDYGEAALNAIVNLPDNSNLDFHMDEHVVVQISKQLLAFEVTEQNKKLRYQAFCRLVQKFPVHVSRFVIGEIDSQSLTLSDRLMILNLIKDLGVFWATISQASQENKSTIQKKNPLFLVSKSRRENAIVIAERIESKSRRWAPVSLLKASNLVAERREAVQSYNILVEAFFLLISKLIGTCRGFSESLILSQFIFTLSSILESCFILLIPHSETRKMAKELWQLVWTARIDQNPLVRRNCIYGLSKILLVLPDYVIKSDFQDELPDMIDWLIFTSTNDADQISKECAVYCLKTVQSIFQMT